MSKIQSNQLPLPTEDIMHDYRLAYRSRQVSLIGRREVLSGKAKFGIFGAGKEVTQVAMARAFQPGDWRSGYYRDQTLVFALGALSYQEYFAQLYAHADLAADPATAGRSMNGHFATRYINPDGSWKNQVEMYNMAADVSPTGSQMPRLVGLAYASRLYRELPELQRFKEFSNEGTEIAWGTIGNASTAEGMFWEAVNAVGVLKAPAIISIYDDGYGISVPNQFQMVKENLSAILSGFQREPCPADCCDHGYDLYTIPAWDYAAQLEVYLTAAEIARQYHVPALVHVVEMTQPQGHSTSGSHERYKSKERLAFEQEYDCLTRMRAWIVDNRIATEEALAVWEEQDREFIESERRKAWEAYTQPLLKEREQVLRLLAELSTQVPVAADALQDIQNQLGAIPVPLRRDLYTALQAAFRLTRGQESTARKQLLDWKTTQDHKQVDRYQTYLHSETPKAATNIPAVQPVYSPDSPTKMAFEILNACFDSALNRDPRVVAFGEDVGDLGDVNQAFRGLQDKYGALRVSDTGIREITILGQAIGMAMRGLRPIAEIQYLDYLLYGLQLLSDDLATLLWRTKGGQKAPLIVRTRGHRLEGIWHSGSPMAGIINLVRGMHVLVPRNAVQAAGFYNTLLASDEPGLVIEVLNAYRIKEQLPDNIGEIRTPLGIPEILRPGQDVTVVTYGACCRIALEAADHLSQVGIEAEVIDIQSLLPFDLEASIVESLKKTNRVLFLDEDVPGGASAYMLQQVIEKQNGYYWLDAPARTLSASEHRPSAGSDGDYWSKPNADGIFETIYEMLREVDPAAYPALYE